MAAKTLMEMGFAVTIVPDSTVGFIMEKVDYVLVGAEAVVENGGIINKVRRDTHRRLVRTSSLCRRLLLFPALLGAPFLKSNRRRVDACCVSGGHEHDRDRGEGGEQACLRRSGVVQVRTHVPAATG